jgi:hypothetical protein
MNFDARRPTFYEMGFMNYGFDFRTTNYRMLYFFHGRIAAVLAHGLVKESEVPQRDIELAIRRKLNFELDPDRHTYKE